MKIQILLVNGAPFPGTPPLEQYILPLVKSTIERFRIAHPGGPSISYQIVERIEPVSKGIQAFTDCDYLIALTHSHGGEWFYQAAMADVDLEDSTQQLIDWVSYDPVHYLLPISHSSALPTLPNIIVQMEAQNLAFPFTVPSNIRLTRAFHRQLSSPRPTPFMNFPQSSLTIPSNAVTQDVVDEEIPPTTVSQVLSVPLDLALSLIPGPYAIIADIAKRFGTNQIEHCSIVGACAVKTLTILETQLGLPLTFPPPS